MWAIIAFAITKQTDKYKQQLRMISVFAAYQVLSTSACPPEYEYFITEYCLSRFSQDMKALDQRLWCSWDDTVE